MLLHSHTCRQTWSKTWVLPSRTLSPNPSQRREGLERQGDCLLNPPPALKPSPAHPSSTRLHRKQEQAGTLDSHTPQDDLIRKLISPWMPALWVHTGRREGQEWQSTRKIFLDGHLNTLARWTKTANFTDLSHHPRHQGHVPAASCSLATKDFSFSKYKLS